MKTANFLSLLWFVCRARAVINASDPCGHDIYIHSDIPVGSINLTISTLEDAKVASACTLIYPNLVIEKSFPGTLSLPNLEELWGDIYVGNEEGRPQIEPSALTGISFPKLEIIDTISVFGASNFATLDFPGTVTMKHLTVADVPKLTELGPFTSLYNLTSVFISNTGFTSLVWGDIFPHISGARLDGYSGSTLESVEIGNNTKLQDINLDSLKKVDLISIWGNGDTDLHTGIDTLKAIEVAGVKSFGTDGILLHLNASELGQSVRANFHGNSFNTLIVDGIGTASSLKISNNSKLEYFSFPNLASIWGDVEVTDNEVLKVINDSSFGHSTGGYTWVDGAINLTGVFTDLSWTPPLTPRRVTILSTGNASCVPWDDRYTLSYSSRSISYNCTTNGAHATPTYPSTSNSGGSSHHSDGALETRYIIAIVVPTISFLISMGFTWWWCVRMRRRRRERRALAAQVAAIATAVEAQNRQAAPPNLPPNYKKENEDVGVTEKPELASQTAGTVVRDREVNGSELGGEERSRGAELEYSPVAHPVEMDAASHNASELGGGLRLSRVEELEARERALAEREDAAIRAREEALSAREREVQELERQNGLISPVSATNR